MNQDFVRKLADVDFKLASQHPNLLHLDIPLIVLLSIIISYGLLILYSALDQQTAPLVAQATKVGMAFAVMVCMTQIPPIFYLRMALGLYVVGIILLLLVIFFGHSVNGSQRWLQIPGMFSFQPSELMKLIVPMILAWYFHDRHLPPKLKHLFWAILITAVPVCLIIQQPDLGTALIVGASGLLVLFLAGIPSLYMLTALGIGVFMMPIFWIMLKDYQQQRILTLLNPERDPLGAGWNIIQSKMTIGSGGLDGKGLFQGTQSHLDFLPESQTDFIIAVLAEELGLVGVMILLILYLLLVGRSILIAIQAQDTFGRLLAGTITFTFFVYVFVNVSMVSGILPVVGVPLPLVSYGGTSILTLCAGFGIIMSIHTHRRVML